MTDIPDGYGIIAGRSRANAQAALDAAAEAGVDPAEVKAVKEGYLVPEAVLEAFHGKSTGADEAEPTPTSDWKNADIKAWAESHDVDLGDATTKADMLDVIASTNKEEQAMPTKCLSLVKGRRIRLTRLDGCGRPVYGDCSTVVSKGFISVAFTANTTETDEINVTNAAGEVCVFEPAETALTGYAVEIAFCEVDPELFSLVTGQPVVTDAVGNVIGFDIDTKTSLTGSGFALELWAGSAAGDACATEGAQGSYGYLLLPFLRGGIVGDFTVENGAVTFTITGAATRDGNAWGTGPYNDIQIGAGGQPGPMLQPIGTTVALRTILTDVAPPEAACGCRPLLDPTLPALTGIAGVATGLDVDFDTTPPATGPVHYDFGDGTWDIVDAPGAASHTYAAAGTYTVKASQNGVWVTTTVTPTGA